MQEQKKNLFKKETTFRNIIGAAYFFNLANPTSIWYWNKEMNTMWECAAALERLIRLAVT